ncbi:MAG: hypothetical protein RR854_02785, partial [Muribaculaceae bacterium]
MRKITFIIILYFVVINTFAQLFNYKQVDSIKIKNMRIDTLPFSPKRYSHEEFDSFFINVKRYDPSIADFLPIMGTSVITNRDSIKFCINLINHLEKAEDFILTESDTV